MSKKLLLIALMIFITLLITGCDTNNKITKNAINYFCNKYNINKKDIKIEYNELYGKNRKCYNSCPENELIIKYNNEKYTILYNEVLDYYGDDYQHNEIKRDLIAYLNKKFNFINVINVDALYSDIDKTPIKYTGDIKSYFNNVKQFKENHKYIRTNQQLVVEKTYTRIEISINVKNENEAKNINDKYSKEIINELKGLWVNYEINISINQENGNYKSLYHYSSNQK